LNTFKKRKMTSNECALVKSVFISRKFHESNRNQQKETVMNMRGKCKVPDLEIKKAARDAIKHILVTHDVEDNDKVSWIQSFITNEIFTRGEVGVVLLDSSYYTFFKPLQNHQ
jgi:hypothetical protein